MSVIVLTIFGFLIAVFMLFWFTRHLKSAQLLMEQNRGVQPLMKQKSAQLKYQSLLHNLRNDPDALLLLQQLHANYKNGAIDVDTFHAALDEMERESVSH